MYSVISEDVQLGDLFEGVVVHGASREEEGVVVHGASREEEGVVVHGASREEKECWCGRWRFWLQGS